MQVTVSVYHASILKNSHTFHMPFPRSCALHLGIFCIRPSTSMLSFLTLPYHPSWCCSGPVYALEGSEVPTIIGLQSPNKKTIHAFEAYVWVTFWHTNTVTSVLLDTDPSVRPYTRSYSKYGPHFCPTYQVLLEWWSPLTLAQLREC